MSFQRRVLIGLVVLAVGCGRATPSPRQALPMATTGGSAAGPTATATAAFSWRTSAPEEQGMDSQALAQMLEAIRAQRLDVHGLVIIRNGYIVAEAYRPPYGPGTTHQLYSVTKSFVSTLVGIAIDQGYIAGVDRPVLGLFRGRSFANAGPRKGAMTLEHLLTMASGLEWAEGDPIYRQMYQSRDWLAFVLDRPMAQDPGSRFDYCSGCSHVLSSIVQQATGMSTLRFAQDNLFGPLGIADPAWETDADGVAIGGWGLALTPRDMARLGYLYLNDGVWQGRQIISTAWVKAATTQHIAAGDDLGYGYQWWIHPSLGGYMARGRGGQLILVLPEQRIVAVFTAGDQDDGAFFALISDALLPAVRSDEALPANPGGVVALQAEIKALAGGDARPRGRWPARPASIPGPLALAYHSQQ